jgi:hypothetical protein
MTFLLDFIKIYQLVRGDTQTDRQTGDLINLTFLLKESRLKTPCAKLDSGVSFTTDVMPKPLRNEVCGMELSLALK